MPARILKDRGQRVVAWFSCGAASAVATKMAISQYGSDRVTIAYIDVGSEHPDNWKFLRDCEQWFGQPITILKNPKYKDTWDVWSRERFIMSPRGAPCTKLLKKAVRQRYEDFDDIQVFGYTSEEKNRAESFAEQNFEVMADFNLITAGLSKPDCLAMLDRAGIEIPTMYRLGYPNNNCIGCPKGGMGYWNKIRVDFPDIFARMAELQRELNCYFWTEEDGTPIFLDELDPKRGRIADEPDFNCSIFCHLAEQDIQEAMSETQMRFEQLLSGCLSIRRIKPTSRFKEDLALDSLDAVVLIMETEEEFMVEIPDDTAEKFTTVGQVVQ